MSKFRIYQIGGLDLRTSPFLHAGGGQSSLIRALNVERDSLGAWKKRPGYISYLGTPDNAQVNTLFSWTQNDGTTLYTYRKSGGTLYYSTAGTGDWTVSGNGTLTAASHVGYAVLDNTMIIGDGTAVTRHTTSGTDFTNTTGAPLAEHFAEYQGRIWAARGTAVSGTNTDLFYSTTGTATDWTTDSSSIRIPGPGRVNSVFKSPDINAVVATKDSGNMFAYNQFQLFDLSTILGPSSAYSIGTSEGVAFYLNRRGITGYQGGRPGVISNAVRRQIYNRANEGITGTIFNNAPGAVHLEQYYCGIGTVTDDLTDEEIPDCILRYDIDTNEFVNWRFANRPYSFHSYIDTGGTQQLIFGDNGGQCYQLSGTAVSDNGSAIESVLEGVTHLGAPESDKRWNYIWAFTNPGCQAKIQVAVADTFTNRAKQWVDLKQAEDGVMEAKLSELRGKLLFWKLYEYSTDAPFQLYGLSIEADIIDRT